MPPRAVVLSLALLALPAGRALGADISILDTNAPGRGLNDPTPATPVGLNFGTTRGDQAIIALQYAASIWGAAVKSPVGIVVDSAFVTPSEDGRINCSSTSGILGLTHAATLVNGDALPVTGAGYPVALANALLGRELTPGQAHIVSRFNAAIGTPGCLDGHSYYYGLVGEAGASQNELVSLFLHEVAHGLGFLSFVDAVSGSFGQFQPSVFDFHVWDVPDNAPWQSVTAFERRYLADTAGALALQGSALAAAVPDALRFLPTLSVDVPGVQDPVSLAEASFSGPWVQGSAPVVAAQPLDGCSDFTNRAEVAGHLVLIQRSNPDAGPICRFWDKANRAQDAGAVGVILFNDVPGAPLVTPSGAPALSIPVGFVSLETGTAIAEQAAVAPVTGTFGESPQRAGVDDSGTRVLLYTPSALVTASSVSHFDTSAVPSLLMEPSIEPSVRHDLDLTPAVLSDLGWTVVKGLSVVLTKALAQQVYPDADSTYLVTLVNRRPAAATGVTLNLTLPPGVSVVSSEGACPSGSFPCELGTVAPGAVLLTVVTLHVPTGAPNPFRVQAAVNAAAVTSDDVRVSTSTLPTVTSTGCSTTGGAPQGVAALLLVLLARRRFQGRRATSPQAHRGPRPPSISPRA